MGVNDQRHAPTSLLPGKRANTHCTGSCVGPRAGVDGCGKSLLPWYFISGPSSNLLAAMPTELSRPELWYCRWKFFQGFK